MIIRVTARHMDLEPSLNEYIEEKLKHLSRFFDRLDEAHVVLSAEGHRSVADVTVHASKAVISSEQDADDARSAFDRALERVERQLRRHKDRVRNRKHGPDTSEAAEALGGAAPGSFGIVSEASSAEPMTPEEALAELDAASVGFLVFVNSVTGKVNVMYRRDDGQFGLVEPGS
jgi:putative sigma-54 modulation protein